MGDYHAVEQELARGTSPDVLCATCPWDRLCIQPPAMSRQEIERKLDEASERDQASADSGATQAPVQTLLTAMTLGGRDQMGQFCPVFALRLRGPDGRKLADTVRAIMRGDAEATA